MLSEDVEGHVHNIQSQPPRQERDLEPTLDVDRPAAKWQQLHARGAQDVAGGQAIGERVIVEIAA